MRLARISRIVAPWARRAAALVALGLAGAAIPMLRAHPAHAQATSPPPQPSLPPQPAMPPADPGEGNPPDVDLPDTDLPDSKLPDTEPPDDDLRDRELPDRDLPSGPER